MTDALRGRDSESCRIDVGIERRSRQPNSFEAFAKTFAAADLEVSQARLISTGYAE